MSMLRKKVLGVLDKNGDGKISVDEVFGDINESEFKGFLIILILMIFTAFVETAKQYIETGIWSWNYVLYAMIFIISPAVIAWIRKNYNKDISNVKSETNALIEKYEQYIDDLEAEYEERIKVLENETQTLHLALELKKQYIDLFCQQVPVEVKKVCEEAKSKLETTKVN